MRSQSIFSFCIGLVLVLLSQLASAQIFPNAPWNRSACERGQCQATFGVCSAEPDGAVVTYVGPIADAVVATVPLGVVSAQAPTVAPPVEAASIIDRSKFRAALMKAARNACAKDKITVAEYFKIAAMSRVPKVLANLEASIHEAAIEEGIATAQAPDWDAIIDFIEKLIPLIIQLIDLFSVNTHADLNTIQYASITPAIELPQARSRWIGLASLAA